jgi:chromosome segregation ATPase
MARGITETDVWQAADALLLAGARPTIDRVRQKIGRGSPNTITPYLETWFRSLGARIADPMAFAAPPALPDPISEAAKHFWEAALAAARAEGAATLEADRAELAAASRKLDDERAQLRADLERINAQLQAKEETAEILRAHLSESQRRAEALSTELARRDRSITDLRSQLIQIEADRNLQRQQLDGDRAAFEAGRRELEAREAAHEERWALEVDRARETTKIAQSHLVQVEKEFASRLDRLTRNVADAEDERRRIGELQARTEFELNAAQLARNAESQSIAAQRENEKQRESELCARIERLEGQLSEVLQQLKTKETEHGYLLRTLIDRKDSAVPTAVALPKRKRRTR